MKVAGKGVDDKDDNFLKLDDCCGRLLLPPWRTEDVICREDTRAQCGRRGMMPFMRTIGRVARHEVDDDMSMSAACHDNANA